MTFAASGHALFDRADFPLLKDRVYLNAAGIGLVPLPVQKKALDFATRLGTEGTAVFFDSFHELMIAPRETAARLFHATADSVAIINSVSEATSQIAAWRRPRRDENVVVLDIDHPSTNYPWLRMAEDTGAEVRIAQVAHAPATLCFDTIARLVDKNTAAISVSHVQWTTGYRFDLKALSELAKAHGALLIVDGTHSGGIIDIDAPASGVDLYATGSFKWMLGYSGTGACYLSPELAAELRPVMVGSRVAHSEALPTGGPVSRLDLLPGAQRLEYGSSAHILRIAFDAAANYLMRHGIDRITDHIQALGDQLIDQLKGMGAVVLTPVDRSQRAGIVTAVFPGQEPHALVRALEAKGVTTMVRAGGVRFSPHGYNDRDDIARAAAILRSLIG